jgi:hypothetical protein
LPLEHYDLPIATLAKVATRELKQSRLKRFALIDPDGLGRGTAWFLTAAAKPEGAD